MPRNGGEKHERAALRITVISGLVAIGGLAHAGASDAFNDLLEASIKEKGVMVSIRRQAIGGRVTKVTPEVVEMVGREFTRIIIRRDSIDTVAAN